MDALFSVLRNQNTSISIHSEGERQVLPQNKKNNIHSQYTCTNVCIHIYSRRGTSLRKERSMRV